MKVIYCTTIFGRPLRAHDTLSNSYCGMVTRVFYNNSIIGIIKIATRKGGWLRYGQFSPKKHSKGIGDVLLTIASTDKQHFL